MFASGNPNTHVKPGHLQNIIAKATNEQLFNIFFARPSHIQGEFCRFLLGTYAKWIEDESGAHVEEVQSEWYEAFKTTPTQHSPTKQMSNVHRVRSEDDQVEVDNDIDYDQILLSPDVKGSSPKDVSGADNETKSASPPSPQLRQDSQKKPKFELETKEEEEPDREPAAVTNGHGRGGLSLHLDDVSDGQFANEFTLEDVLDDDELKVPADRPKLSNQLLGSDDSFALELLASIEATESDAARERRELAAMTRPQVAVRNDDTANLVDVMFDLTMAELQDALHEKLELCRCRFNMVTSSKAEAEAIRKKTDILEDILNFFVKSIGEDDDDGTNETSRRKKGKKGRSDNSVLWYSPEILVECIEMVMFHIFRPLPASPHGPESSHVNPNASANTDEESDGFEDVEWPHLELVYKILLFLVSANTQIDKKYLGRVLKERFIELFMDLFLTEDRRERECLKTILHRIYGRFMGIRKSIRVIIAYDCYLLVYGDRRNSYGISEFLQILVSVIHGYAYPVKDEHKCFLRNVLLPLHKCRDLVKFHEELGACMYQFVFKDPSVGPTIFGALLKFWPNGATLKQEILLTEMKNIIAIIVANATRFDWDANAKILGTVVDHLTKCMKSRHHMVAQRAISIWADDAMQAFCDRDRNTVWRKIASALVENQAHWNVDVKLATEELVQYMNAKDPTDWQAVWVEAQDEWDRKMTKSPPKKFSTKVSQSQKRRAIMWTELANMAANPAAARMMRTRSRSRGSRGRAQSPPRNSKPAHRREHSASKPNHRNGNVRRTNSAALPRDSKSNGVSPSASRRSARSSSSGRRGLGFTRRSTTQQSSPEESRPRARRIWK